MKRFLITYLAAVVWLTALCILATAEDSCAPTAERSAKAIYSRSYSTDYFPYLGGAYRHPDAYLPCYPGYAPYWQRAQYYYPYAFPPLYYPFPYYPSPILISSQ
ncbi:MAG TPA: hypothetical protein VIH42_13835 [Thermoguttaceae bacterium]